MAFVWSFLFACAVIALGIILVLITGYKNIDPIVSLSILAPFVIFLYYKTSPERNLINLVDLISSIAYLYLAHIFGIFFLWILALIVLNQYENVVAIISMIFIIQIITGFLISVLHGLLPLIKFAKLENRNFLRLTFTTIFFVLVIFLNNASIEKYFGNESSQIFLAIALTLTTTITVHFIHKNCSKDDEKLLIQSIKTFVTIVATIIWLSFIGDNNTQHSINSLLALSTSFLLPVAFSFLFSSILVIVDLNIPQSNYKFDTENSNDIKVALTNLIHIPINLFFYLIIKALAIPQK